MGSNQSKESQQTAYVLNVSLLLIRSRHPEHRDHPIYWRGELSCQPWVHLYQVAFVAAKRAVGGCLLQAELHTQWHPSLLIVERDNEQLPIMATLWSALGSPPLTCNITIRRRSYIAELPPAHSLLTRRCSVCGIYGARQRCGRCSTPSRTYCGRQCQIADWPSHRLTCIGAPRGPQSSFLSQMD